MQEVDIPPNAEFTPNDIPEVVAPTIHEKLKTARLDFTEQPPEPEPVLMVNDAVWGTLGNLSLVIGKAKSGKTFLIVLAMIAALRQTFGNLAGCLPEHKRRVIFFDTEQGSYHVWKTANRVLRLTDDATNFEVYKLRQFNVSERFEIINYVIETTPDIGLVIIDGVRDLVSSINDESEATKMSDWLLRLTELHNIHVITLLHQNKGIADKNARGHLGSELVNKAETTLSVTSDKEKDIKVVEAEYCRDIDFEPFAFQINDSGLPEIIEDYQPKNSGETSKHRTGPDSFTEDKHHEIVVKIFNGEDELSRRELMDKVKHHYGGIGEIKAREFITYLTENNLIHKPGKTRNPKSKYTIYNPHSSEMDGA